MKKVLKLNNKGFVLVETLIATVFVTVIFSIVYMNLYPLIGEYESRENYEDVKSKYGAYWVKRIIENRIDETKYDLLDSTGEEDADIDTVSYMKIDDKCIVHVIDLNGQEIDGQTQSLNPKVDDCEKLFTELQIKNAYITKFNIEGLRQTVKARPNSFSSEFKEYIYYLPSYGTKDSNRQSIISEIDADYRVLVEFEREAEDGVGKKYKYKTFANMEVKRHEAN